MTELETFNIEVAPSTFTLRSSGSIVGQIWMTIGDWRFPNPGWDDFPVVVLAWWTQALLSLTAGENDTARCSFMDGPYLFEISAPAADVSLVRSYRNAKTGTEFVRQQSCRFSTIRPAMLSAAETTINACRQKQWASADLDRLIEVYSVLSKH